MVLATAAAFFPLHGASGETGSRKAQPDVGINADPAVPIPAPPSLGIGEDRALVLGGGGEILHCLAARVRSRAPQYGRILRLGRSHCRRLVRSDRRERGRGRSSRAVARRYRSFRTVSKTTGGFDTDERVQPQSGACA